MASRWSWLLLAWLVLAPQAQAQGGVWRVRVTGHGCPDAALVERQLVPLLPADTPLEVVGAQAAQGGVHAQAQVVDLGDRYRIELGGSRREVGDTRRDCLERARVAAVFLALNRPPAAGPPKPARSSEARVKVGLQLQGVVADARALERPLLGAGAGGFMLLGRFALSLELSWLLQGRIPLGLAQVPGAGVELSRWPMAASAGYLLSIGPVSLGPAFGLLLDLVQVGGDRLPEPDTGLRVNPGLFAGALGSLALGDALSLRLRLGVDLFARAYRLELEPGLSAGELPRQWLGAQLGLGLRL